MIVGHGGGAYKKPLGSVRPPMFVHLRGGTDTTPREKVIDLGGSLPNDVRTYYSTLTLEQVNFYKHSFSLL